MQNLYQYLQRQQSPKNFPAEQSPPFLKPMNPRSSYQQEHSTYFQKLQEQLLQKSNRYTSLIGKKAFGKQSTNQAILSKISQLRVNNQNSQITKPLFPQNKPLKNKSYTELSQNRKASDINSTKKIVQFEQELKSKHSQHLFQAHLNNSLINFHTELDSLQPRTCVSRQGTQRTQDQNLQSQHEQLLPEKSQNCQNTPFHVSKSQNLKSKQLVNKIDHIKQVINNFNSSKKPKEKQGKKETPLQMHRKLVYNLTYEDKNPSILEDLPQSPVKSFKSKKAIEPDNNILNNKYNKNLDHLSSTMSTKISINHNSNQSSKLSLFKKQNEHFQTDILSNEYQKQHEKIKKIQKNIIPHSNTTCTRKKIQTFNHIIKITPQLHIKPVSKQLKRPNKQMTIDDFIILAEIGEGKTGSVYMAKHTESSFLCALKVISREILNENMIVQLMREIQLQYYLDHPNIVQLYAFFSDQENIYLMLELCFSGNLYTHLRRQKVLSEAQIKPIIKQVCYALEFMHDNEIIHRDLKPQNILFHQDVVKICDLGWAVYSPLPRDTLCGTPLYASPQLVEKKQYNSKIDVWNVGVMTYELLCGRVPFEIRSQADLYKVVFEQIHFPRSIPISQFCKDFINCSLNKQPQKRKTITELLEHYFLNEDLN